MIAIHRKQGPPALLLGRVSLSAVALLLPGCGGSPILTTGGGSGSNAVLTVSSSATTSSGTVETGPSIFVAVTPGDHAGFTGGTVEFLRSYNRNTVVTLTAPAKSGTSVFTGWTGGCVSTVVTCKVVMSQDQTAVANYKAQ